MKFLLFNTSRIRRDGIYDFNLSASSGTFKQTVPIEILMVNVSPPPVVSFDNSNPLSENVTVGKTFTLDFMNMGLTGNNSTFSILSIGENNFSYTLFTDSMQANITFRGMAQLALGEITLPEGKSYALDLEAQTNFTTWTIVGYNRNYQAAIAILSEGPA